MNKLARLLLPILVVMYSHAFAQDKAVVTPTGFLSDYARLMPDKTAKDNYFHYTTPEGVARKMGKIYFMPITGYPADVNFQLVDKPVLDETMTAFDQLLRKKLEGKATLVGTPDEADTTVQMVVTAVATVDAGRAAIDFIPLRLLTKPLKDAAMGKEQQIVVTLEMSIRDSKTGHVLYEAVHRSEGKNIGRSDDKKQLKATGKELSPVIDSWTDKIVNEIVATKK